MRHGLANAERVADRQHHVADLQIVGIGEFERRKFFLGALDAQYREIAALILEHDIGVELPLVGERDFHLVGIFYDMKIGDDKTRRIDDNAGTERALDLLARHAAAEELAEERICHKWIIICDDVLGIDVDDRRRHAFHDRREGQLKLRRRARHLALLGARAQDEPGKQKDGNGRNRLDTRGSDTQHRGITPNQ